MDKRASIVSGVWMGRHSVNYYVLQCSISFCKRSDMAYAMLPNNSEDLNAEICASNRKGIICGECKEGYGLAIGDVLSDCVPCDDKSLALNIVKYLSSVYLPLCISVIHNTHLPAFATFLLLSYSRINSISTTVISTYSSSMKMGQNLTHQTSFLLVNSQKRIPDIILFPTRCHNFHHLHDHNSSLTFGLSSSTV